MILLMNEVMAQRMKGPEMNLIYVEWKERKATSRIVAACTEFKFQMDFGFSCSSSH